MSREGCGKKESKMESHELDCLRMRDESKRPGLEAELKANLVRQTRQPATATATALDSTAMRRRGAQAHFARKEGRYFGQFEKPAPGAQSATNSDAQARRETKKRQKINPRARLPGCLAAWLPGPPPPSLRVTLGPAPTGDWRLATLVAFHAQSRLLTELYP